MLFCGVIAAGGVFAGTNPSYTPYELENSIRVAKIRLIIVEPELLENAVKAAKACSIPLSNVLIFNEGGQAVPEGFKSWRVLLEHGEQDWVRFNDKATSEKTSAARLFSSGTTGLPKALDMSHYNFGKKVDHEELRFCLQNLHLMTDDDPVAQHTLVMEYRPRPYAVSCPATRQMSKFNW